MNSACAEILLHNLIVSTNFQRHICAPTEGSPSQGELSAELTEGVPSMIILKIQMQPHQRDLLLLEDHFRPMGLGDGHVTLVISSQGAGKLLPPSLGRYSFTSTSCPMHWAKCSGFFKARSAPALPTSST